MPRARQTNFRRRKRGYTRYYRRKVRNVNTRNISVVMLKKAPKKHYVTTWGALQGAGRNTSVHDPAGAPAPPAGNIYSIFAGLASGSGQQEFSAPAIYVSKISIRGFIMQNFTSTSGYQYNSCRLQCWMKSLGESQMRAPGSGSTIYPQLQSFTAGGVSYIHPIDTDLIPGKNILVDKYMTFSSPYRYLNNNDPPGSDPQLGCQPRFVNITIPINRTIKWNGKPLLPSDLVEKCTLNNIFISILPQLADNNNNDHNINAQLSIRVTYSDLS